MTHTADSDRPALAVAGVSKSYGSPEGGMKPVLSDVSFAVNRGEVVSVFGPNGSGKTTLLKIVAGLLAPDRGQVFRDWEADRKAPGVVFQNYSDTLLPWATAAENIAFPLLAAGAPRAERIAAAERMARELGISFDTAQYPYRLSGGQQQICCIARALVHDPGFLLLDEPFSALDIAATQAMQEKILEIWAARRLTVVMITHDLDEAILMASRFVLLEGSPGRVGLDLPVRLPYPRTIGLLETPEFFEIRKTILGTIRKDLAP